MVYNPFSLENKTVFVTGASSGIGKAIAIECSKMGAQMVITGRNGARLNETFQALEGEGHLKIEADLSKEQDIRNVIELLPQVDGIVHCAGIIMQVPFSFTTKERLDAIFSVNFNAPALISQQLLKHKKINKCASIVFISSISGVMGTLPGLSLYSATKGAVNGLAKGMAVDLAPLKIRVNCINPAMIQTALLDAGTITEDQYKEDALKYPLKRYGQPEEVAYAAIYLLSDASAWVTGSNLLIDGGITLV